MQRLVFHDRQMRRVTLSDLWSHVWFWGASSRKARAHWDDEWSDSWQKLQNCGALCCPNINIECRPGSRVFQGIVRSVDEQLCHNQSTQNHHDAVPPQGLLVLMPSSHEQVDLRFWWPCTRGSTESMIMVKIPPVGKDLKMEPPDYKSAANSMNWNQACSPVEYCLVKICASPWTGRPLPFGWDETVNSRQDDTLARLYQLRIRTCHRTPRSWSPGCL